MKNSYSWVLTTALTLSLSASSVLADLHPVTNEVLADEQVFTYRVGDEYKSIDPQLSEDVQGAEFLRDLFEGLMNQNSDGDLVPGVATHFDVNDDNTIYTFHLRDNAKWSDGEPVTAGDFEYSWKRLADPATASPYAWFAEGMGLVNVEAVMAGDMDPSELGVTALDDLTLEVRLENSMGHFPLMTTSGTTFPSPKWVVEEFGSDWTKPENIVSNGAYVLTEHVPQERSVRTRNPMYWNDEATIIERVVALVISDESAALTRYLSGELDRTEVPSGQFNQLSAGHPTETVTFPRLCNYYYFVNLTESTHPALLDPRVREALYLAIDRDVITEAILQGGEFPAYSFTPEATANFLPPANPARDLTQAERNARAVALLDEAGYGGGAEIELDLLFNTSESHSKIAIIISQMWKQTLGVTTVLQNMEWKTFLEARSNQEFDIGRAGWCGDYNLASSFLDLMRSDHPYNDAGYVNAEVDQLLTDAKVSEDPTANFTRIEEILATENPILPIYHYAGVYMMDDSLQNWPVNNVEQKWYSRELYFTAN
jgi:oligopeptide transport system substrate-binding protein